MTLSLSPVVVNAEDFRGIEFGVGISLTIDSSNAKDRVESAEIVNGIVRVNDENNTIARILLESHFFFEPDGSFMNLSKDEWGHGPFIAIQPGDTETIDAIGLGWMIGFKKDDGTSWNIGIGFVVDPNTKVLGDGLEANTATTETEIRFKEETETGILLMSSFSF